jgi:hypothetical protein
VKKGLLNPLDNTSKYEFGSPPFKYAAIYSVLIFRQLALSSVAGKEISDNLILSDRFKFN